MKDKTKENKSKKSITNETGRVKKQLAPKRNTVANRPNAENGIGMSKQLQLKLQKSKRLPKAVIPKSRSKNKNSEEPRVCGNGKPMPSLSELEQMFDDSDTDDEQPRSSPITNSIPATVTSTCTTPKKNYQISEEKLKSPNTIKLIADRMLDHISNLSDSIEILDNNGPLFPVVPPKKRKKPDEPYIVGCKDRPQIPNQEYGKKFKLIHDTYMENNSNLTAYLISNNSDRPRSFSPIPSTSRDSDVIHKNDVLFNESLQEPPSDEENNLEIINPSYETITIDDSLQTIKSPAVRNGTIIEIDNDSNETNNKDDACEIIENLSTVRSKVESPIIVEDYYSSLDLNQPCNIDPNEVIDVDDVIAENNAIIEKYRSTKQLETVTSVNPGFTFPDNSIDTRSVPSDQSEEGCSNTNFQNNNYNSSEQTESRSLTMKSTTIMENNSGINVGDSVHLNNNQPSSIPTINIEDVEVSDENQNLSRFNSASHKGTRLDNVSSINENNRNQNSETNAPTITTISQSVLQEITDFIENDDDRELCLEVFYHNIMNVFKQGQVYIIKDKKSSESRATPSKPSSSQFQQPSRRRRIQHATRRHYPPRILTQETRPRVLAQETRERILAQEPETPPSKGLGDCPICMDSLANNSIASTVCGHVFCMKCIKAAVKSSGKRCPTCRKALKGGGFHQLFL